MNGLLKKIGNVSCLDWAQWYKTSIVKEIKTCFIWISEYTNMYYFILANIKGICKDFLAYKFLFSNLTYRPKIYAIVYVGSKQIIK